MSLREFQVKRAVLVAAAIAVALPASAAVPTAFGAGVSSTLGQTHKRVRHGRRSVDGPRVLTAAPIEQQIWREEHRQHPAADRELMQTPLFPTVNAKVETPSVEWDCSGGDAGCSWEPYGWRRN